jgi:hypothetical protein
MTESEIYAALRPRPPRRTAFVVCFALACASVSWLGFCAVQCAQVAGRAYAAKACAMSGGVWTFDTCAVPQINIEIVPRGPAEPVPPGPSLRDWANGGGPL